ncbi:hypothetical protein ACJJTC_017552 [Scirpophaga incertulas]
MKCVMLVLGFVAALATCSSTAIRCLGHEIDGTCVDEQLKPDQLPQAMECRPGTRWLSKCHLCHCSDFGVAQCKKQEKCETDEEGEPLKCKPNSSFVRECNSCVCLKTGLILCTVKDCFSKYDSMIPKQLDLPQGKDCAANSSWRTKCNLCKCSHDGHSFCTPTACDELDKSANEMQCAPETVWRSDCNTCSCTKEGRAICTKMGCDSFFPPTDEKTISNSAQKVEEANATSVNSSHTRKTRAIPQQEAPKNCQPGQEFRLDCNKCLCDNQGQDFSCTRIDCNALNANNNDGTRTKRDTSEVGEIAIACSPGSVFDENCNTCRCTKDGRHAMCTMKRCDENKVRRPSVTDLGFRCNAGEQFRQDCNDCTCSADGRSFFCTLRVCDEFIRPAN